MKNLEEKVGFGELMLKADMFVVVISYILSSCSAVETVCNLLSSVTVT